MNKEFIGKKKFYLEDDPDIFVIVRIYVVETRQNEYFTAVFDNGDAFQIDEFEGPDGSMAKSFLDFENRRFIEYPTLTIGNIHFFDRDSKEIGVGEVSSMKIGSQYFYMGSVVPYRSFKYKKNGWDFKAEQGERITALMERVSRGLDNKYFQIWCRYSEK